MSEFAFEQDPGGYEEPGYDQGGWDGGGGQGGLDPLADPAEFEAALGSMVDERLAPAMEFVAGLQREAALSAAGDG